LLEDTDIQPSLYFYVEVSEEEASIAYPDHKFVHAYSQPGCFHSALIIIVMTKINIQETIPYTTVLQFNKN